MFPENRVSEEKQTVKFIYELLLLHTPDDSRADEVVFNNTGEWVGLKSEPGGSGCALRT